MCLLLYALKVDLPDSMHLMEIGATQLFHLCTHQVIGSAIRLIKRFLAVGQSRSCCWVVLVGGRYILTVSNLPKPLPPRLTAMGRFWAMAHIVGTVRRMHQHLPAHMERMVRFTAPPGKKMVQKMEA